MNAYLDASALVSLFAADAHTRRIQSLVSAAQERIVVSEWSLAEFTSALGIGVRSGTLSSAERDRAEATLDTWMTGQRSPTSFEPGDAEVARRLILATLRPLRAADALHLAIVRRLGASLVSFDKRMCEAAADLGIEVEAL